MIERIRVLLGAIPTKGAVVVAALTAFATYVVPLLPGDWPVKVGAWAAAAIGVVTAVIKVVSAVTPVPASQRGLLPP